MNYSNISNQRTDFSSPNYCYQPYTVQSQFPQPQTTMPYSIIQENNSNLQPPKQKQPPPPQQQQQQQKGKSAELKFKIESVGAHPEDDDDLDMCPARTRPYWPKQIIPWWVPSHPNEKPPYSYATLIAHAILSSKDGRLTLNDIYTWISKNYPTFSVGNGGWQNSIRHNLSLNKKWFYKIDRRPTQANPGKGCYWTLIAGTEQIFIDNLTQEGGHSRKHHDIGLTAELSIGQRRGVCYYNHNPPPNPSYGKSSTTPSSTSPLPLVQTSSKSMCLDTPPLTPTKPEISRPLLSPLYTTFRMVDMTPKSDQIATTASASNGHDSDNDSAVDVNDTYIDRKHIKKRRLVTTVTNTHPLLSPTYLNNPPQQSILYDPAALATATASSSNTPFIGYDGNNPSSLATTPNYEINHWVEDSLLYSGNQLYHNDDEHAWMMMTPIQPPLMPQSSNTWSEPFTDKNKKYPIIVNLDDDEVTQKYLHFTEEEESQHNNNDSNNQLLSFSSDPIYCNLYPPYNNNTTSIPSTTPTTNEYPFNQFVSMQDILYS